MTLEESDSDDREALAGQTLEIELRTASLEDVAKRYIAQSIENFEMAARWRERCESAEAAVRKLTRKTRQLQAVLRGRG